MSACEHCGQALPHKGTSWKEAKACRVAEVGVLRQSLVVRDGRGRTYDYTRHEDWVGQMGLR